MNTFRGGRSVFITFKTNSNVKKSKFVGTKNLRGTVPERTSVSTGGAARLGDCYDQ